MENYVLDLTRDLPKATTIRSNVSLPSWLTAAAFLHENEDNNKPSSKFSEQTEKLKFSDIFKPNPKLEIIVVSAIHRKISNTHEVIFTCDGCLFKWTHNESISVCTPYHHIIDIHISKLFRSGYFNFITIEE